MLVKEIRKIAKKKGVAANKMKKPDMVRAIQKAEGNYQCFQTGTKETCGQYGCLWREDCW